mgnify:CR=1 FL=1
MLLDERTIRITVRPGVSDEIALRVADRVDLLLAVAIAFIKGDLDGYAPDARPIGVETD